jgi:hypothetical protein
MQQNDMHNFSSIYSATDVNDSILNNLNPNSTHPNNNTLIEINLKAKDKIPKKMKKGSRSRSRGGVTTQNHENSILASFGGFLNSQHTSIEDSIRNQLLVTSLNEEIIDKWNAENNKTKKAEGVLLKYSKI